MVSESDAGLVRTAVLLVAVLVLAPVLTMLVAMPMMGMMGGWGGAGGARPGGWGLGATLLWFAAVLGVGYLVYRGAVRAYGGRDRALEELRLAYARGELSDEEFDRRRERLERERE